MPTLESVATIAAAIVAALTAGIYLAFTVMVLPALRSGSPATAITVMQRVNVAALRPPFMLLFFGGTLLAVAVIVTELASGAVGTFGWLRLVGAGLALLSFVITVVRNVPLNTALAAASSTDSGAWVAFDRPWGRANLLRAGFSTAGAVLLVVSLFR